MTNERLSEWLDGEAGEAEGRHIVQDLVRHASQSQTCGLYWLIGDCLRGEGASARPDFTTRVMAVLEDEPAILAPAALSRPVEKLRWMPMAAAVAGFTVAVWMGFSLWTAPMQTTPVAMVQKPASVATVAVAPTAAPVVASSDVQAEPLDDERGYLMAHQASAIGTPMAGVAQYIRTVGIEEADKR